MNVNVHAGTTEGVPDDPATLGGCTVITWNKKAFVDPYMAIEQPGKYCLDRDYHTTCLPEVLGSLVSAGHYRCRGLEIQINSENVELDLKGHTIGGEAPAGAGIEASGRNVMVRNGVMNGPGGITMRLVMRAPALAGQYLVRPVDALPHQDIRPQSEYQKGDILNPKFKNTTWANVEESLKDSRFVIENMVLGAIRLSGGGNIVRNNRIEFSAENLVDKTGKPLKSDMHATDSRVGILNYGPGALIENNEIMQRTDNKGVIPAYAIYIRQGDGAVIRGNRIRNSGETEKTIAIGLRKSKAVVLENNLIRNFQTPVEFVEDSSAEQRHNQISPVAR